MERRWTIGFCWRCEAVGVWVLWLGPVQSLDLGDGSFFCCEPCVRRMEALLRQHNRRGADVPDNGPLAPPRPR